MKLTARSRGTTDEAGDSFAVRLGSARRVLDGVLEALRLAFGLSAEAATSEMDRMIDAIGRGHGGSDPKRPRGSEPGRSTASCAADDQGRRG